VEVIDFKSIESKVFLSVGDKIYVGGEIVTPQMRSVLRDQARNFQTTQLFELLNATATNEGVKLLLQAGTLEHLQFGKSLNYWNKIMLKMINALAK
jgi:hypothetical protein